MSAQQLITDHIDLWTATLNRKATQGRGSSNKIDLHGIKKLRELILELAVRGKLVPQDPSDEPAEKLLERIAAEKAQLVKDKKIKKPKKLPEISDEEKPFDLPQGWAWVRFGDIFDLEYGDNLPKAKRSNTGEYPVYGSNGIVGSHEEPSIVSPCIVIGRKGSAGALNLSLTNGCWVTDVAYSLAPHQELDLKFTFKLLHTLGLDDLGKGIKPGLNRNEAYALVFALPPKAEQHRIVAKVDELMALCDQLENQTRTSIDAHQTLATTLLDSLLIPAEGSHVSDAAELEANWARVMDNFDLLFTANPQGELALDHLKQTILQLAVMGKLVKQDPNDEPANKLLERIAAEKAQLIKDKKIKKQKPLPEIGDEEKPFELPEGWEWCRFFTINTVKSELVPAKEFPDENQIAPDSIEKNTGKLISHRTVSDAGAKGPNNRFYKGQLLYSKIRPSLNKVVIAPYDGLCSADMYPIISHAYDHYTLRFMLSEVFLQQVRLAENRVKMPKLNLESLGEFLMALPPVSEQHRIVAKVDQLMALCDQLKDRLQAAQQTQLQLTDTVAAIF
jgi:type I restriction enzyme, S subunit